MRGLTWDPAAFEHERERLRIEEAHSNDPNLQLSGQRDLAVWGGRGYGSGLLDAQGNTRGPTLDLATVRAFYDTYYHPRNAAVVVVGPDPEASLAAIAAAFSALPAGPKRPPRPRLGTLAARTETLDLPLSRPGPSGCG